jgi:hypothetical protein
VADTTGAVSGDESRGRRMHKDILESARYPKIVFTPSHVEAAVAPQGMSHVLVHACSASNGAGHEITIPVEVNVAGTSVTASARFIIAYVQWPPAD